MTGIRTPRRAVLRRLLAGLTAAALAGCDAASRSSWLPKVFKSGEHLNRGVQKRVAGRKSMAQEFSPADLSPEFRSNGTARPASDEYARLAANQFADWSLQVDGLVRTPTRFSLAELRALPWRTQITRHDCVEGWSAIGQWTGVPLVRVLDRVVPLENAQYVVFHCADTMGDGMPYYESIDFDDAYHPQTILAYGLNGKDLPVRNGAPLRVRIERQLGYKMAKFIMRIELVESLERIGAGNGGYWEDRGYEWYAGI
jgi:DMSO/TMAO reductase YedYZ molybdopterin-dependent catalytic subunit